MNVQCTNIPLNSLYVRVYISAVFYTLYLCSCPKLYLFSGHDTTLVPLLRGVGAWSDVWPPYSSDLAFELYENRGEHLVKVVYNGQVCSSFCILS